MADKVRRLWRTKWGKALVVLCAASVVGVSAALAAAKVTESNKFCGTDCHEMLPYDQTWQASRHDKVDCVRCHIPPGMWNFAKTKFFAMREVYVHFIGGVSAPIQVTRNIPNVVCLGCHPASQTSKPVQLLTATFSHPGHRNVPVCVDCHAQLVHHPIQAVPYIPPQSMTACFKCHNGKQQPNGCSYCHQAPHPNRGACQDCHSLQSWSPKNFHHPVPLTGKHAQVLCETCHNQPTSTSIGFPAGCVSCHGNHHNDPKLTLCAKCHTTTHFVPSTFVHQQVGPHVPKGDEPIPCDACHQQSFATASCSCHGNKPPTAGG